MRVSTLLIIVVLVIGLVGGGYYLFGGVDGFMQWQGGFGPATTPDEAMEKFRNAIQKRKYKWASNYCTKDYAELLAKAEGKATRVAQVIDKITDFMENKSLQTDQTVLLLNSLDPFPPNFKIQGAVKASGDKEATGVFMWEQPKLSNAGATVNPVTLNIDPKMFMRNFTPTHIFSPAAVKLVKEGEHWKLDIPTTPDMLDAGRYYLDHCPAYESELGVFRTYMVNDRFDSNKAFENEVVKALRTAAAATR